MREVKVEDEKLRKLNPGLQPRVVTQGCAAGLRRAV